MHLSWYSRQVGFAVSQATPPPALADERLMRKWEGTGSFWLPWSPQTIFWGTIVIVPGVGTKVVLEGNLFQPHAKPKPTQVAVLHGKLFNGSPITCFDSWCTVDVYAGGKALHHRSEVSAQLSVFGGWWSRLDDCKPDYLNLKLTHLNEWFDSPYAISYQEESLENCTLSFNQDTLESDFVFRGVRASLKSFCARAFPYKVNPNGDNWNHSHHLIIEPESPQGGDWLLDAASSIRSLFVFLTGSGVYTLDVIGISSQSTADQSRDYHFNLPVVVPRAIRPDPAYFSTRHCNVREVISEVVKAWFEKGDELKVVTEAYKELLCSDGASHGTVLFRIAQTLEHLYGVLWQDESRYVKKATFKRFVGWLRHNFPREIEHVLIEEMTALDSNREIILSRVGGLNDFSFKSKLTRLFCEIPPGILGPIMGNPQDLKTSLAGFLDQLESSRHYLAHFSLDQEAKAFSRDQVQDAALICWSVLTFWIARKLGLDLRLAGDMATRAKDSMFLVHQNSNL